MREQVGDPEPALALPAKLPVGLAEPPDLAEEDVGSGRRSERLAVRGDQLGLVVERVDLAHRPAKADVDCSFRLRGEVRASRVRLARDRRLERAVAEHQRCRRRAGEAAADPGKKSLVYQSTYINSLLLKRTLARVVAPNFSTSLTAFSRSSGSGFRPKARR